MMTANLIPARRLKVTAARRTARRWIIGGTLYAMGLVGGLGAASAAWSTESTDLEYRLAEQQSRLKSREAESHGLSRRIDDLKRRLAANRAVTEQPDWSVLLSLLAECLGDDAALRRFRLRVEQPPPPAKPTGDAASVPPARATTTLFVVQISGIAKEQSVPPQLVQKLQDSHLFDTVKLLETRLEPSTSGVQLVAFEVECRLGGQKE
ncbi:MAG: hypothetical protein KF745_10980 [Phycisphaeraceae bacterium]|nr:hypothetical protein [Phycisphaeraceae bacterium]